MEKIIIIFVFVIVFGKMIANEAVNNFLDIVWMIACGLFIVFLGVFYWMDHKGMFTPDKMYKKKDKEG